MVRGVVGSGGEVISGLLAEYGILAKLPSTCLCLQIIAVAGIGQG